MTAKQTAGRLNLSVILVLSSCVLVALAAGTLFLGSGSTIQPRVTHKTADLPKPHLLNASSPANSDARFRPSSSRSQAYSPITAS